MKADFQIPPQIFRPIVITIETEEERLLFRKAFYYLLHSSGEEMTGKVINDLEVIKQDFFL